MTHHKKVYRVLVYLAILGAVDTGATYAKYVSQVGSQADTAAVTGFNVTAKLETSNANMSTGTVTKTEPNQANFTYTIKDSADKQQMKVTFTNNSKVWVQPTVTGSALAYTDITPSDFSNSVIKQGESKAFVFNVSSTGGTDKTLNFNATQVLN